MNNNDLIRLLAFNNYVIYNKDFAKRYGVEETILIGAMCYYQQYANNDFFCKIEEDIQEDTGLTIYAIRKAKKNLQKLGILTIERRGVPSKHFYLLNIEKLFSKPSNNHSSDEIVTTSSDEIATTSSDEIATTNNYIYINQPITKNNNNNIKEGVYKYTPEKVEDKPPLVDINVNGSLGNKNYDFVSEIIGYLNAKTGKRFSSKTSSTIKFINGRLSEGYTVDDMKRVVDIKTSQWLNTDRDKYLRPETLFNATKFAGYVNEKMIYNSNNIDNLSYEQKISLVNKGLLKFEDLPVADKIKFATRHADGIDDVNCDSDNKIKEIEL